MKKQNDKAIEAVVVALGISMMLFLSIVFVIAAFITQLR